MPGNFGIPNEGAQLDALGEVIDANSEMLEGIIVAAMYPLTTLLTDNECLLDSVASGANRLLSKIENPIGKELSRIADALVAQLAYETGATGEELNRALALAEDVALPDADEPAQQPLADAGPAIQDILEGDVAAGGDFGPDAAAAPAAQVDRAEAPPRVGLEGLGRDLFERWAPVNDPDAVPLHKIPCAMGGQGVVVPEALDKGLPLPGSKLFYENIDAYLAGFSALGAQLAGFVGNELTKENLIRMVEELETKIPNELSPSAIQYKIFVKTMRFVVEHSESVLSTIRNSVK